MTKIINWRTDKIIIEDEKLSIKELVEKAVKEGISLQYADLRNSDLIGSNLENADLENSDLVGSNLENANLRGSNLVGSNLAIANLRNSDLIGSNLEGADLRVADLFKAKINQDQLTDLIECLSIEIINKKENDNT